MPRAGLSPDRVVDEAALIADEVGLDRLSLAMIATRLGVRVPSLYKHIEGLDALRQSLAIRARQDLAEALTRATVGKAGADAVDALAAAYRGWAGAHPGRYTATQRVPDPNNAADLEASNRAVTVVVDALASYGLSGDDAIDATRALRAALHGFVSLEAANGFGLPLDIDRSYARLVTGLKAALANWNA